MPRVPSAAASHIGQLMAERRRVFGISQDAVGVASGIDSSNIRAFENGRAMPSIHSLIRIAHALDIEPGSLIDGITLEMFSASENDGRRRSA